MIYTKVEAISHMYARKGWVARDDFIVMGVYSIVRYTITDLTQLQTSALLQDINFEAAALFSSSNGGARREGAKKEHEASASQNSGGMRGGELRANEALT